MEKDYVLPSDTLRFLEILGKDPASTRVRMIPNKRSICRAPQKGICVPETLMEWKTKMASIYLVVNDGGDDDASITKCLALFLEHDELKIEEQAICWKGILPEPSMQVYTGGKSLHQYWVFEEPVDPERWRELTQKAIIRFRSDPTVSNPSRLMRLPGYTYFNKEGSPSVKSFLFSSSGIRYSVNELEEALANVVITPVAKAQSLVSSSCNSDWKAAKPCPICGRDIDDKCRMHVDNKFVQCHVGDTFMPPDGKNGSTLKGIDGQLWKRRRSASNVYGDAIGFSLVEDNDTEINIKTKADLISFINKEYGPDLAWNDLKKRLEYDDKVYQDLNLLHCELAENHGVQATSSNVSDAFLYVSKKFAYNPVHDLLLKAEGVEPICELDEIGTNYLGLKTPIESRILGIHLLASVYRAFKPGYEYDQILIMRGPQGVGKTRAIKTLAGSPEHYISTTAVQQEKDFLMQLGTCWHVEFEEIDGHIDSKHEAALKALISRHYDNYRAPYAAAVQDQPRPSIFWGTTNQEKLLVDSTGNRRMMIIDINSPVNHQLLQKDLLGIWAVVMKAYRAGVKPILTLDERRLVDQIAIGAFKEDPWLSTIDAHIEDTPVVFEHNIYKTVLGIEVANIRGGRSGPAQRVYDCLKQLGYKKYEYQINGLDKFQKGYKSRTRGAWFAPEVVPTANGEQVVSLLKAANKELSVGPGFVHPGFGGATDLIF